MYSHRSVIERERYEITAESLGDSIESLESLRIGRNGVALAGCNSHLEIVRDNADELNAYLVNDLIEIGNETVSDDLLAYLVDDKSLALVASVVELIRHKACIADADLIRSRNNEDEVRLFNDIENMGIDTSTCVDDDIFKISLEGAADLADLFSVHRGECLRGAEYAQIACHRHLCNSVKSFFLAVEDFAEVMLDAVFHTEHDIETAETEVKLDDEGTVTLLSESIAETGTDSRFTCTALT